ncbi:Hpt domain protein [Pseudanabaena biceps PCC 7429]|uniref:Hpt domain protein n=2 Tax=Pseudanabaena TaxID=1152 RepID=L8N4F6_9CYAN|nr:Hpt domain protein [Pseudanabaena biceps PCC 7429]
MSLVKCCIVLSNMNQQPIPPIDLAHLHQISEGDIEFEIDVLRVYIEDISQRIESIRKAIANDDLPKVMGAAHHIKGASGNVGALQIQSLAIQLEKLGEDQGAVLAIIDEMLEKIKVVEQFIDEKSASLSS